MRKLGGPESEKHKGPSVNNNTDSQSKESEYTDSKQIVSEDELFMVQSELLESQDFDYMH